MQPAKASTDEEHDTLRLMKDSRKGLSFKPSIAYFIPSRGIICMKATHSITALEPRHSSV
jgi:hypothetical protein